MLKKIIFLLLAMIACAICTVAAAAEQVRVALVAGQTTAEISCDDEFEVVDGTTAVTMPKGKYFVHEKQGRLYFDESYSFSAGVQVRAQQGAKLPRLNKRAYAGSLRIYLENDKLLVVNTVDLEAYLASVLPAKSMVVWPDEAIKAQAVAARSYALHARRANRYKAYDLVAMDAELRYEGTDKRIEKPAVTKMIQATAGQYLVDANGLPIKAVTTSSSGGRTESALNLLGEACSYLQSVEDYDSDSPEYTWEYRATPALLEGILAQRGYVVGKLTSIRLSPLDEKGADRTPTGRVKYLMLAGSAGTVKLNGSELAEILSLNSTLFDVETGTPVPETLKVPIENRYGMEVGSKNIGINVKDDDTPVWKNMVRSYHMLSGGKDEKIIFHGRGKGSGLGLSAWGARGLANADEKNTYRTILAHYYPGARLIG